MLILFKELSSVQFSHSVTSNSETPWTAARQASLSITNSQTLLKLTSIEFVFQPSHPLSSPSLAFNLSQHQVLSNELVLHIKWPSIGISPLASVLPMNIKYWFPLGLTGWISLQSKGLSRVFSNTTVQKHQFFSAHLSLQSNFHIHTWLLEKT